MIYVTKGLFGGWTECKDDEKRTDVYVLVPVKKYREQERDVYALQSQINTLNSEKNTIENKKEQLSKQLRRCQREVDKLNQTIREVGISDLQGIIDSQNDTISKLRESNAELRADVKEIDNKNKSLYRRLKIEAGKQKGIQNKKEHSGYVVLSCRQVELKGHKGRFGWSLRISTPFTNSFSYDEVKEICEEDLIGPFGQGYLFDCLDYRDPENLIERYYRYKDEKTKRDIIYERLSQVNRTDYELNLRENFWEVKVEVFCKIKQIPMELLPQQKRKKKPSIDIDMDTDETYFEKGITDDDLSD